MEYMKLKNIDNVIINIDPIWSFDEILTSSPPLPRNSVTPAILRKTRIEHSVVNSVIGKNQLLKTFLTKEAQIR